MSAERRLAELGIELDPPRAPRGAYVPARQSGALLLLSGQTTDRHRGVVGVDVDLDEARSAARDCALNLLSQARAALGSLDEVAAVLKLTGYVACGGGFADVSAVVDGASRLLGEILGDRGAHARSAVGVAALPKGSPVELDAILEVQS
jgi:enamine deaminase RidA (YjgF/YER057c/UK114 family)